MDGFAQPGHTEGNVSAAPGRSGASPVRNRMVSRVHTVAFNGIDVLDIDCQVQLSSGMVAFNIVGLPDKAVAESRERVRAALAAMGLALPPRRITVNLAPADVLKEGSHFDLPIAVAVLMAMDVLPNDAFDAHPFWASSRWMARSPGSPASCPPPSAPTPPGAGSCAPPNRAERPPGPVISMCWRRLRCCRWSTTSKARRCCPVPNRPSRRMTRRSPTCGT